MCLPPLFSSIRPQSLLLKERTIVSKQGMDMHAVLLGSIGRWA